MSRLGVIEAVIVLVILAAAVHPGTAQFETCHDNAAADCRGNMVTGVSTIMECCLGDGFWFNVSGQCVQCIVHGFNRTMVFVDEGDPQETFLISLHIKGNTTAELPQDRVNRLDLTVMCVDVTTEGGNDYSSTACGSRVELDVNDPAALTSEVLITFPVDSVALEGTEDLRLELQLLPATQAAVTRAGNIFFQNKSIQIRDTTVLTSGFQEEDYSGNEGPDRSSLDPNAPCSVTIRLQQTSIETDLTFQLTPRTVFENVNASGPPPTASLIAANASRADFNTTPIEVTMAAGTEAVTTSIPIVVDEINEAEEEFVVVLDIVNNTTNPLEFTIQTTVCRIPENDPIDIGFRRERIEHNETTMLFSVLLEKDRESEQTFVLRTQISTPQIQLLGEPATEGPTPPADFRIGPSTVLSRLDPDVNFIEFAYTIFEDNTPENTEIFQLSSDPDPIFPNPRFTCDVSRGCFQDLQVLILDDDVVVVGFVETLVEVDESDGQATLRVNITFPEPNPALPFEIMFRLDATMMNITAGQRPASSSRFDPVIPGIHDYQEVDPALILPLEFENTQRLQTFNVLIFEDGVPEDVEELNITLSLQGPRFASSVTVRPAVATVRIRDNDRIVVGFERTSYEVNEADGQVELCAIVIQPADQNIGDVTFNLTVETQDDTAMGSGIDYNSVMTTLATFTTQQPRQCFNVTIIDDAAVELTENFFANLMLVSTSVTTIDPNRITVDPAQATVNITDNDLAITVGYVDTAVSVFENAGVAQLTVRISMPSGATPIETSFSLLVNTSDGTATAPSDYGALGDFVLGPFNSDVRQLSFNVSIVNDVIPEENEDFTASLTLSPADRARLGSLVTVEPDLATVTVIDDDVVTVGIEEPRVVEVTEGVDPTVEYCVVVTAPDAATAIERDDFSVCVSTVDGTAVAGEDYDMITDMRLGPFGNSNRRQCFTVNIRDDDQPEVTENFMVNVSFCPGEPVPPRVDITPRNATTVINDDDVVVVGFEQTSYTVQEDVIQFDVCVVVTNPIQSEPLNRMFSLSVSTSPGTADNSDYTEITNQIVGPFSNSQRRDCFSVEITNDNIPENSEDFSLVLAPVPGQMLELVTISPDLATVTIQDDEVIVVGKVPPLRVTVTEGVNQTVECCVQITGPNTSTTIQRDDFSLCVSTRDGSAVAGGDYGQVMNMRLGPFGNNNRIQCFNVTVIDDDVQEETEEFMTVVTFCPGEPVPENITITPPTSTVVIQDNDVVVVGFEQTSYTVQEDVVQFDVCVVVTNPIQSEALNRMFSLSVSTSPGTADNSDYTEISNQVVGPFSNLRRRDCFSVEINNDNIPENSEDFSLVLTPVPGQTLERVTISPDLATVTIEDDEDVTIGIEPPLRRNVTEGVNPTVEYCVVITVPDMSTAIDRTDFRVCVSTVDGTAIAGQDFVGITNMPLGPFGNNDRRQCFNVSILSDTSTAVEPPEDFMVVVNFCPGDTVPPNTVINPPNATTTIFESRTPPPPVRVNDTVTGDPLMTVPLNVGNSTRMLLGLDEGEHVSLCYEVHGEADKNFNLVSDTCVSVNAHYINVTARGADEINIINRIGVRAVDDNNQCHDIRAELDGCRAFVDGVEITMPYRMAGISVRKYPNRVRIAVPNCVDFDLVMWVFCQNGTFEYNATTFQSPMIRFVIARGFNLNERSHGILGQFWNIPIDVVRYNQPIDGTVRTDTYAITVNYPGNLRQFVGFLYSLTWEFDERQCLYVGNGQGGPIDEVDDPNDPVLQGEYTDYIVDDLLGTEFEFAHFDSSVCSTLPTAATPA